MRGTAIGLLALGAALLPAANGSNILELASAYNASNQCVSYYATESWNGLPAARSMHAFVSQAAALRTAIAATKHAGALQR